jgi:hypothetical protein
MLTFFSALMGFLTSGLPSLLKFLQDRHDKAHELALLDRQLRMHELLQGQRLEELRVAGLVEQQLAQLQPAAVAYAPSPVRGGSAGLDALAAFLTAGVNVLTASVRPVVTYLNNAAFWALVFADALAALAPGVLRPDRGAWSALLASPLVDAVLVTYASINGYWFGTRTWQKLAGR